MALEKIIKSALLSLSLLVSPSQAQDEAPKQERAGVMELLRKAHDSKYDSTDVFMKETDIRELSQCVNKILIEARYEVTERTYNLKGELLSERKYNDTKNGHGSMVLLRRRGNDLYYITNHHVTSAPEHLVNRKINLLDRQLVVSEYRLIGVENRILIDEIDTATYTAGLFPTTKITELMTKVKDDEELDVALMRVRLSPRMMALLNPKECPRLGNSDDLDEGNFIYVVGYPLGISRQLSAGIVTSKGNQYLLHDDNEFYTSAPINKGNSGGGAFAIRDGIPELVGLPVTTWLESDGLSSVIRINRVKQFLDKHRYSWLYKNK